MFVKFRDETFVSVYNKCISHDAPYHFLRRLV